MHKERIEGRKAYSGGQEATRECNSPRFLLQPTSNLLSGVTQGLFHGGAFAPPPPWKLGCPPP